VSIGTSNVLLCDEDRDHTEVLAHRLAELGHGVTVVRTYGDAFAAACAEDYDALLTAPFLRDGAALALPSALGIRRPRLVVLVSRMTERLATAVAKRVGFDAQMTKIVDVRALDRLLRAGPVPADRASGVQLRADVSPSELGGNSSR